MQISEKTFFFSSFFLSMMITKHLCFCIYMMTLVNFCYSENLFKNNVFFTLESMTFLWCLLTCPEYLMLKFAEKGFKIIILKFPSALGCWPQNLSCSCKFIFFCKDINLWNPPIFWEINFFAKATHLKKKLSLFFHNDDWRNGCKI